jgi:hypothetical protein
MFPKRCYLDTSVVGGYYDAEFAESTRALIDEIRCQRVVGVISDLVVSELRGAPAKVRDLLLPGFGAPWEVIEETEESMVLAKAYLEAGVVAERFEDDCRHVAMATVDRVDILLSWNCRHIVHYDKIRLFNAVNLIKGYDPLEIRTPSEVIEYEE